MTASFEHYFPGGFTVLMAVYDGDSVVFFERAIHSIFKNSLLPKELLLVVDGPVRDEFEALFLLLQDTYGLQLRILRLHQNEGLAKALNYGLTHITTAWVVRADADDVNLDHRFATLANMICADPSLELIGSAILEIDENGMGLAKKMPPIDKDQIKIFGRRRNPFNHMTVAFRLDMVRRLGFYPPIHLKEDYGLWCKCMAADVSMLNTNEVLVLATTGHAMYQRRGGLRYVQSEYVLQKLMFELKLKTYAQALTDGLIRSIFFLMPAHIKGLFYLSQLRDRPSVD